jgi:hypothetical protein
MNDPFLLTGIAILLAVVGAVLVMYFLRSKRIQPRARLSRLFAGVTADSSKPSPPPSLELPSAPSGSGAAPPATGASPDPLTERRRLGAALVMLGFFAGLLSLYLRRNLPAERAQAYLPFLGAGLLFFLGGMYIASRIEFRTRLETALARIAGALGLRAAQAVCLAGSILFAGLATVAAGTDSLMIDAPVAIAAWLGGIALAVAGGWDFAAGERKPPAREALLWAGGLTLGAFLLRAILVGRIPVMLTGDEGSTGLDALLFRNGQVDNPFGIFGWHPFPSLYFFLESLSVAVFGRTTEALRLPSALAGALTVGGLYFLVRAMYSHRHALAAALFLCGLHLHMHFSRLGVMNVWDGLWYLIALGGLWYGWKTGKRGWWIIAGLALGIGQYFYATTRALFVAVAAFLAVATVLDRGGWRRNLRNLLPALAGLVAVLLPLAWYVGTHLDQYLADIKTNSILGPWMELAVRDQNLPAWRILLNQLSLGFGGFFSVNLSFWYRPEVPILRTLPAVFFIFGLAMLVLQWKDLRTWVPVLWLLAYGMIVSLSESTPAAQRLPGVSAAVALVVGFGVVELVLLLGNLFPVRKLALGAAAVAVTAFLAADDLRFYFYVYTPQSVYLGRDDFVGTGGEVARRIVGQLGGRSGEWEVVFFDNSLMGFFSDPAIRFLLPRVEGQDMNSAWGSPDNPPVPEGRYLFFVFMPDRETEIDGVRASYPGGTLGEIFASDGSLLYTYYDCRPDG